MTAAKQMGTAFLLLGLAALLFLKPTRILLPEMAGVRCPLETLCIEETDRLSAAQAMYLSALQDIENRLGPLQTRPKVVFCSTTSCFNSFGFSRAAARSIGVWGIVVGPRGWKPHYLRHEFIHHWQAEQLGNVGRWFAPEWLVEGMAYALSDDPRDQLGEPLQSYRSRFTAWYRGVKPGHLAAAMRQAAR